MKGNSASISEVRAIGLFVRKNLLSQPAAVFFYFIQLIEKLLTDRRVGCLFRVRCITVLLCP
jgi:hypothetical protein